MHIHRPSLRYVFIIGRHAVPKFVGRYAITFSLGDIARRHMFAVHYVVSYSSAVTPLQTRRPLVYTVTYPSDDTLIRARWWFTPLYVRRTLHRHIFLGGKTVTYSLDVIARPVHNRRYAVIYVFV